MSFGMEQYSKEQAEKAYWAAQMAGQAVGCTASSGAPQSQAPRQITIPERLEQIEISLYELGNTLERTLDTLVGPRPCDQPAPVTPHAPFVDDILDRIARQLSAVHETANSIHRQIVRQ